tara:strand:- start:53 stop:316 length:264 start_codon:yes stop_codon:yes gene_type:complete
MKNEQESLFGDLEQFESWRKEWQDMPEFKMENLTAEFKLTIHFERYEDVNRFAELVGQNITSNTKSIWFPEVKITRFMNKRYIDEEE